MKPTAAPIPWTTSDILKATGGDLLCGDVERGFARVSIDSRTIGPDDLFVAVKGDVHDGHSFTGDVIAAGVRGLVISRKLADAVPGQLCQKQGVVCVTARDTIKALGALAAFQRKRANVSVAAITGSNGKTTTRAMTTAVVAQNIPTLATSGNLNNEIGLPLTLLNLDPNHRWAIVELGMNSPGEIGRLAKICMPDIGVITNIGPAHLEGLGSLDAVMQAKGELLPHINPNGTAVLNADDPKLRQLSDQTPAKVLLYGTSEQAKIRARAIQKKELGLAFTLELPPETISVELKTPGRFMVSNALAAASVGYLVGLSAGEIKTGLEAFEPVKGRLNIVKALNGIHIIDDTYNANPGSMSVAIATLQSLKGNSRGILIVGDMLELGDHSESMHRKIGALSARSEVSKIYATGKFAPSVAAGAREEHMDSGDIIIGTKDDIFQHVTGCLNPGDWVLVKGSRSMAMEEVVARLLSWADD